MFSWERKIIETNQNLPFLGFKMLIFPGWCTYNVNPQCSYKAILEFKMLVLGWCIFCVAALWGAVFHSHFAISPSCRLASSSRYLGMSKLEKLQYWLQSHQFEMSLLPTESEQKPACLIFVVWLLWWLFCVRKRGVVDFICGNFKKQITF